MLETCEPSARSLDADQPLLLRQFELLATAPGGVARLRELILALAVQGKLAPQDPGDEPASELLRRIRLERTQFVAAGSIKQGKPCAPVSPEEEPCPLPRGWAWVRFGDLIHELCTGPFGSLIHKRDYVSGGVPLINPSHMIDGRIEHDSAVSVSASMASQLSAYRLSAGDVLLARRGEMGRYALVTEREAGWLCGTGSFFLKLPEAYDRRFFGLTLEDPRLRRHLLGESVGATMTNLNQRILLDVVVAVAPLAEQARIVARVDELMRLCDALEAKGRLEAEQHARLLGTLLSTLTDSSTPEELAANWQRVADQFDLLLDRPEAVDALEKTILQLAVRGLLVPQDQTDEPAGALLTRIREHKARLADAGEIRAGTPVDEIAVDELPFNLPQTWAWTRFGDITINRDGERIPVSSSDRERRKKVYDYYGASGVIDKIDGYLFDKTLLLIGEDGANLLNRSTPIAFLAHGKYWVNNHAHVIDTIDAGLLRYLELFVNAISLEPYVTGTAQPKMNQAKLNSIVVALPPLAEQSRIVGRVTELRRLCAELRQCLADCETTQTHLAEALVESAAA